MKVYHGSSNKNLKFRKPLLFFTTNKADAENWANRLILGDKRNTGTYIYTAELNYTKLYEQGEFNPEYEEYADLEDRKEIWDEIFWDDVNNREELVKAGYDCFHIVISEDIEYYIVPIECKNIIKWLDKETLTENADVLDGEKLDTSNENFWKWFTGSKCVNEYGEPLKVYHGTSASFTTFNKRKLGKEDLNIMSFLGFHFTPDKEMADRLFRKSANDKILECYLSIKNPYVAKESDMVKEALELGFEKGYIDLSSEKFKKIMALEYFNNTDGGLSNVLAMDGHYALKGWEHSFDLKAIGVNYLKYLKSQGYDGVKYLNEIEWASDERYDWIAFEPKQIKAVENNGQWSDSANIYEHLNRLFEQYL